MSKLLSFKEFLPVKPYESYSIPIFFPLSFRSIKISFKISVGLDPCSVNRMLLIYIIYPPISIAINDPL